MKTLASFFSLFPNILASVAAAHSNMPNSPTADKKSVVLSVIDAACKVGEVVPNPIVQGIAILVDTLLEKIESAPAVTPPAPSTTTTPSAS